MKKRAQSQDERTSSSLRKLNENRVPSNRRALSADHAEEANTLTGNFLKDIRDIFFQVPIYEEDGEVSDDDEQSIVSRNSRTSIEKLNFALDLQGGFTEADKEANNQNDESCIIS